MGGPAQDNAYPSYGDFCDGDGPLSGEKRKLDDILNQRILILGYRIGKSKFKAGDYMTIQFANGGKEYVMFTGSNVLISQLEKYQAKLPFYTNIEKRGKYYTLT